MIMVKEACERENAEATKQNSRGAYIAFHDRDSAVTLDGEFGPGELRDIADAIERIDGIRTGRAR